MGLALAAIAVSLAAAEASGTPRAPRAARSVHLWYRAPEAVLFQNDVTVEESRNGTYFAVCGFQHGYFGIQQLGSPEDKVVIFSVWDPGKQNDPASVEAGRRVRVLHRDEDVRVKRFGGEGTGAQSFYRYPWKVGETCRFAIRSRRSGDRTAYAAFFYLEAERAWKHLATFETLTRGEDIRGFYSFIEDFRRDGRSPRERRAAVFSGGWVRTADGAWIALAEATFTADRTPLENINAAVTDRGFRLETGGETRQRTALRDRLRRVPTGLPLPEPRP